MAESVEGADHDEVADRARTNCAAAEAAEEIIEGPVGPAVVTLGHDRLATFLPEVADVVKADAHGEARLESFRKTADVGAIDVDRQRRHAVTLHVFDQHARVVEAHRLVVQQPAAELDLVVQLHPRCLVRSAGKSSRVRPAEPVNSEALHRREQLVGHLAWHVVGQAAADELILER